MAAPGAPKYLLAAVLVLFATVLVACGSGDDSTDDSGDETTTQSDDVTTTSEDGEQAEGPSVNEAEESIDDAAKNLEEAVAKDDCKAIKSFVLAARTDTHATKENCKLVVDRLQGATLDGADGFDGSGVIDFTRGTRTTAALMVVDRDGLFKLLQLAILPGQPSVGTPLGEGFDEAAEGVVEAIAEQDCDAFRELSSYYQGPGSARLPDEQVCAYVKDGPIAAITSEDPDVKPTLLGGNSNYAFYGVGSDTRYVTLVMTRQTAEGLPPGLPDLPNDAAEYVFLTALVTDAAPAPQE